MSISKRVPMVERHGTRHLSLPMSPRPRPSGVLIFVIAASVSPKSALKGISKPPPPSKTIRCSPRISVSGGVQTVLERPRRLPSGASSSPSGQRRNGNPERDPCAGNGQEDRQATAIPCRTEGAYRSGSQGPRILYCSRWRRGHHPGSERSPEGSRSANLGDRAPAEKAEPGADF